MQTKQRTKCWSMFGGCSNMWLPSMSSNVTFWLLGVIVYLLCFVLLSFILGYFSGAENMSMTEYAQMLRVSIEH